MNRTIFSLLITAFCFFFATRMEAQKLVVESFTAAPTDISASQYPRKDLNGHPCGLVKVQLAVAGAQFEGNVIAPVEYKTGEYWVYMTEGSKELVVKTPSTVPLHINFGDYQISGIVPKATYVLALSSPQTAGNQKQQVSLRYSPSNAMVLIDDQAYQSANGQLALSLPLGDHSYIVSSPGYDTVKGVLSLSGGSTRRLNVTLEPSEGSINTVQTTQLPATQAVTQPTTATTTTSSSSVSSPVEVSTNPSSQTFTANGVSFKMIRVEGGTFTMGATSEQGSDVYDDEKPAHQVTLSSYYIGETEVTQALWQAVMGTSVSQQRDKESKVAALRGVGSNYPMYYISWEECQQFILKLNSLTDASFRLPTEEEWEYAARGGNKSKGYKYSGSNMLENVAWYKENSGGGTHPVRAKFPNELGLYDMSGNVWEWCQDWKETYSSSLQTNPTEPSTGSRRMSRGGGFFNDAVGCRVSIRGGLTPVNRYLNHGLRLAL